jgi:hypothetical protein
MKWRIIRRIITSVVLVYAVVSVLGAVVLEEIAVHPPRLALGHEESIHHIAEHDYRSKVRDAIITASDGAVLRGWLVQPEKYNGNAVIILHGVADNRESSAGFAGIFLSRGYAVLVPDSRAHGASGGSFGTYGVRERQDVHQWIDWLIAQETPHCVYLLGESMGAAIAIQATAADSRICATVAESPFVTFREVAFERVGQMTRTGPWLGKTLARPMVEFAFLITWLRTGVNLTDANPESAIANVRTPVLLIHGAADSNILPRNSEELHQAAPDHTELWIVPGAEHCGASATQPEEFNRRVLGWFADHPNATR